MPTSKDKTIAIQAILMVLSEYLGTHIVVLYHVVSCQIREQMLPLVSWAVRLLHTVHGGPNFRPRTCHHTSRA